MANVRGLCRRLRASYGRAAENEDLQKWRSQERLAPWPELLDDLAVVLELEVERTDELNEGRVALLMRIALSSLLQRPKTSSMQVARPERSLASAAEHSSAVSSFQSFR